MSSSTPLIFTLPPELQVRWLTYLRAYDLAPVAQTCRYYASTALVHSVVEHCSSHIYPKSLTKGFEKEPVQQKKKQEATTTTYTLEHLRNMELLVVARVLAQPEPESGYIVSKSWCKTALKWLEQQQQQPTPTKKKITKKQRVRSRRLSNAMPPWPNANADLLCEHEQLQPCNRRSQARRKLLRASDWKTLQKLFPQSTPLPSARGACLQCQQAAMVVKQEQTQRLEQERLERRACLEQDHVRAVYTRSKGVPEQAKWKHFAAAAASNDANNGCPLVDGTYYIVPREWCSGWRRFIKTGEGGLSPTRYHAPDATPLLCRKHGLVLVPPHLEAFLYGETEHLYAPAPRNVHGMDHHAMQSLLAAGLTRQEVRHQLQAMRLHEEQTQQPQQLSPRQIQECLDRENHVVVEIVTQAEWQALEHLWPDTMGVSFQVPVRFGMPVCRECDATSLSLEYCQVANSSGSSGKKRHQKRVDSKDGNKAYCELEY